MEDNAQLTNLLNQLRRLINLNNAGSGSSLSQLTGSVDVPYAQNFRIVAKNYTSGEAVHTESTFTLGWLAPDSLENTPGVSYNIYALRSGIDRTPTKIAEAYRSPIKVAFKPLRYDSVLTPVTFYIQTQLASGERNSVSGAPTQVDYIFYNTYNIRFGTQSVNSTPPNGANPGITLPANPATYIQVKVGPNGTPYYVPAYPTY